MAISSINFTNKNINSNLFKPNFKGEEKTEEKKSKQTPQQTTIINNMSGRTGMTPTVGLISAGALYYHFATLLPLGVAGGTVYGVKKIFDGFSNFKEKSLKEKLKTFGLAALAIAGSIYCSKFALRTAFKGTNVIPKEELEKILNGNMFKAFIKCFQYIPQGFKIALSRVEKTLELGKQTVGIGKKLWGGITTGFNKIGTFWDKTVEVLTKERHIFKKAPKLVQPNLPGF